jgi:putative glutathione S-transferase
MSTDGFKDQVSSAPGAEFPPEKGRYLMFVSHCCPWAHGATIARELKGLEDYVELYEIGPVMGPEGWYVDKKDYPDATYLLDLYKKQIPGYSRRATVPTLFDKKTQKFVNNESHDIIRMFNAEFDGNKSVDLLPEELAETIARESEWIIDGINRMPLGILTGTDKEEVQKKKLLLTQNLQKLDALLAERKYILGDKLTELDVRAYPANVRYDIIQTLFPQEDAEVLKPIRKAYPNIHRWVKDLYWNHKAFKNTTKLDEVVENMRSKPFAPADWSPPQPLVEGL